MKSWKKIIMELEFVEARLQREMQLDLTESEREMMRVRTESVNAQLSKAREELSRLERAGSAGPTATGPSPLSGTRD